MLDEGKICQWPNTFGGLHGLQGFCSGQKRVRPWEGEEAPGRTRAGMRFSGGDACTAAQGFSSDDELLLEEPDPRGEPVKPRRSHAARRRQAPPSLPPAATGLCVSLTSPGDNRLPMLQSELAPLADSWVVLVAQTQT